ncbi:MAG: AlwI family type II restriction endonuclease [Paludibacteraceae bacterium]|nr:AlwI family type II restriction endonuclease [Paludibacteraceae bacterium]
MAYIDSRTLFITTSPRTPERMLPEIALLSKHFTGQKWDADTQRAFMDVLREENFFNGKGENDPAFSARDRINRAPKALGFVQLSPTIKLTPAGENLLHTRRTDEAFLRQMLKFQLPSPFHKPTNRATTFCVKPYLEFLRLIRTLGSLRFDELQIFALQLTDWHKFESIITKIEQFRKDLATTSLPYKKFKNSCLTSELSCIYVERINIGDTKTRESQDTSLKKFLHTQASNLHDYADATVRYLRATGLVNVSHIGRTLSIVPERVDDVDYILKTIDRTPLDFNTENEYISYLGNANSPLLLTDNKEAILKKLHTEFPKLEIGSSLSIEQLKDILTEQLEQRKANIIKEQVEKIKDYRQYDDIQNTFKQIEDNELYDAPLMLEWNTWRAMTMLDGGEIKANLNFDDYGQPLSIAQGNMSDIVCDYGDFYVSVEVTMASGQRQYETESEPVSRHLGKLKKSTNKPTYCLFIAPTINDACIAHFYTLHHLSVSYYGGKSTIIPLPLTVFKKMVEDSYKASYIPNPKQVQNFFEQSNVLASQYNNEKDWYSAITSAALNWLEQ